MEKITIILFLLAFNSLAQAQDMKGMNMNKKETKQQPQPVIYTCPMHSEIHATKPGNCPKCGMKLVKKKPKQIKQQPVQNINNMQMPKDTTKNNGMGKKNMNMHKDTANSMTEMDMNKMQMNMSAEPTYFTIQKKYLSNNTLPRTVRYDLYIADTMVTFGKNQKEPLQ